MPTLQNGIWIDSTIPVFIFSRLKCYRRKPISQIKNDLPQTYKFQSSVPTSWRNVIHLDSVATPTTVRNCCISLYTTRQKATKLDYHKSTLFDFHSLTSSACGHKRREQETKCWQRILGIRTIRPFVWPPYQNRINRMMNCAAMNRLPPGPIVVSQLPVSSRRGHICCLTV
jgi:hypothetical protein